ncbi:enamine deaminase RidA (YjgF/YER057c/UK114 family) [Pontibacter ummariensis]|uniref:Enamine deaminase RidA, house cleaning of reactive enamine intermediates, YjgF/YER057c/UK114 family n=1 Tax=Pontibacter ummariensis TaxID=1610492 RepID=A0A239KSK2_9BACT|nr:RidA family protein [Pontibacter ummariensis]PRY05025.1 enamine deaminase RidA (YjgF/YER057c/UK114 family) [Pontibacter ummariensis]SNT21326.1 Enamine deaminase RidA, house cleaning of reactive enamine intermediates, YjgF/YER057c/UK114 family [Pontibacter ummariensis]
METLTKPETEKQAINPWQWQDQLGFAQAIKVKNYQETLFCAGQTAMSPEGKPIGEGDMRAQIGYALDNLETVLAQAAYSLSDVVRLNYYTTDVDLFFQHYDVVLNRLAESGSKVSSTLLGVSRLAFPQLLIEIEATAVK